MHTIILGSWTINVAMYIATCIFTTCTHVLLLLLIFTIHNKLFNLKKVHGELTVLISCHSDNQPLCHSKIQFWL